MICDIYTASERARDILSLLTGRLFNYSTSWSNRERRTIFLFKTHRRECKSAHQNREELERSACAHSSIELNRSSFLLYLYLAPVSFSTQLFPSVLLLLCVCLCECLFHSSSTCRPLSTFACLVLILAIPVQRWHFEGDCFFIISFVSPSPSTHFHRHSFCQIVKLIKKSHRKFQLHISPFTRNKQLSWLCWWKSRPFNETFTIAGLQLII